MNAGPQAAGDPSRRRIPTLSPRTWPTWRKMPGQVHCASAVARSRLSTKPLGWPTRPQPRVFGRHWQGWCAKLSRKVGAGPRPAPGLTATALAAIRATAGQRQVGKSGRRESAAKAAKRGPVDIALCSVMRDALMRRSEAAALKWGDIETLEDGSGDLTIRVSNSDPEGRGSVQYLGTEAMRDLAAIRPPGAADADLVFGLSPSRIGESH